MFNLQNIPSLVKKSKRRLGRGTGSGRGKTSGRGTKGQKSREKIRLGFEGGQLPLIKRLPLYRGKGRNKVWRKKALVVNLKYLNILPKDTRVDKETLVKYNLLKAADAESHEIKILGEGELTKPLKIALKTSKSARLKIEKAGGKVVDLPTKDISELKNKPLKNASLKAKQTKTRKK